jgi:hypothetical protein
MKRALIALTVLLISGQSFAYPKCDLYSAYRCVPTYGNKIVCGCGL